MSKIDASGRTVKTGGRQKGTPNKTTVKVKEAFEAAFEQLGGVDALVTWGQAERSEFYKLYAKLLPVQVTGDKDNPIVTANRIELVALSAK
jgi:hypothetical protein